MVAALPADERVEQRAVVHERLAQVLGVGAAGGPVPLVRRVRLAVVLDDVGVVGGD